MTSAANTDDHAAAVEWLETVYYERIRRLPHPNQHGLFNFRDDSARETPGQDAATWPTDTGFRRLTLAGCDNPEQWFIEFFYRGWHDEITEQTPAATQLPVGPGAAGDGVRERRGHAERQVQEDPVPDPQRTESVVLV